MKRTYYIKWKISRSFHETKKIVCLFFGEKNLFMKQKRFYRKKYFSQNKNDFCENFFSWNKMIIWQNILLIYFQMPNSKCPEWKTQVYSEWCTLLIFFWSLIVYRKRLYFTKTTVFTKTFNVSWNLGCPFTYYPMQIWALLKNYFNW